MRKIIIFSLLSSFSFAISDCNATIPNAIALNMCDGDYTLAMALTGILSAFLFGLALMKSL